MSDTTAGWSARSRWFSVVFLALTLVLVACGAPVDDQTDLTSTTNQTEETIVESTSTTSPEESSDEESTEPEIPVTTTKPEKKDGLPVPPDPSIPPPRD